MIRILGIVMVLLPTLVVGAIMVPVGVIGLITTSLSLLSTLVIIAGSLLLVKANR